jgi:hypothetical protein
MEANQGEKKKKNIVIPRVVFPSSLIYSALSETAHQHAQ